MKFQFKKYTSGKTNSSQTSKVLVLKNGQIKSKSRLESWLRAVDFPKKQTDEFDLFAFKSKKANKTNSSVHFLGEDSRL